MKTSLLSVLLASMIVIAGSQHSAAALDSPLGEASWTAYEGLWYSFLYPSTWRVEDHDRGEFVVIYPSDEDVLAGSKIEIAFIAYEISDAQDLRSWYDRYLQASQGNAYVRPNILRYQSSRTEQGLSRQELHTAVTNEVGPSQSIKITHGRLVLTVVTYTHSAVMTQILEGVASSIRFSLNAPRSAVELSNSNQERPSLEQVLAENKAGVTNSQDIVARDLAAAANLPSLPPAENSTEFLQNEKQYREWLHVQGLDAASSDDMVEGPSQPGRGSMPDNRKALPPNWTNPTSWAQGVGCSSAWHTGKAAQAIDIQVPEGTTVRAAQAGSIQFADWTDTGYGYFMRIATDDILVADENRKYWHEYAHLKARSFQKVTGPVNRGEWVANSGNTGNSSGPHLHFHVYHDVNRDDGAFASVHLAPMVGFSANTSYPDTGVCGSVVTQADDPIIIEPVMFTQRYHPRANAFSRRHYWFCFTSLGRTTECYMEGVPNNGQGWEPLITYFSPELRYTNVYVAQTGRYYLWVCGRGGSYDDDSLHMGLHDYAPASSQAMSGWHPNQWIWRSIRMNGTRPYLDLDAGQRTINVWMREDGMRIDRILMTRDVNYDPTGLVRCGG